VGCTCLAVRKMDQACTLVPKENLDPGTFHILEVEAVVEVHLNLKMVTNCRKEKKCCVYFSRK
jgi:hypothetical protein